MLSFISSTLSGRRSVSRRVLVAAILLTASSFAVAEDHTGGVPALSSRPGAAYTIYLNPSGFTFDGLWNQGDENNKTPGFTPSLNDVAPTSTFSAVEQTQIKVLWQQVAQSYIGLNVNVTTVDPAPLAIQGSDSARQAWYDSTPNMMHTVIGSQVRAPRHAKPDTRWKMVQRWR